MSFALLCVITVPAFPQFVIFGETAGTSGPDEIFRPSGGGKKLFLPFVFMLKMLRRIHKWVKNMPKKIDP